MWDRGHAADAMPQQQQADAAAWAAAVAGGAIPEAILTTAKGWIGAYAHDPNYLPKLSVWLTTSWNKPPPKRSKRNAKANGSKRVNASDAIFDDGIKDIKMGRMH